MKKILTIVVAMFGLAVFADQVQEQLSEKIRASIAENKADDAAKWSAALASYNNSVKATEEANLLKSSSTLLGAHNNLYQSLPAILDGIEYFFENQKIPRVGDNYLYLKMLRLIYKATLAPLTTKEITDMTTDICGYEKAVQERWEEKHLKKE